MPQPSFRRLAIPGAFAATFLALNLSFFRNPSGTALANAPLLHTAHTMSGVFAWIACAWLTARLLDLLLRRAVRRGARATAYPRLLSDLLHAAIFFLAVVGIFTQVLHQSAAGLIATSSILIAIVGFALRYIVGDIFSGIALNFDHPYAIGDWIEPMPNVVGRVIEITWRTTRLVTRDGVSVVVPNGLIANGRLSNYSAPSPTFRIVLRLSLDSSVPIARAKEVLLSGALAAMHEYPGLRPDVLVQDYGEAGVVYVVRFWVPDYEQENMCRDRVTTSVFTALRAASLELSAPKREILTPPRPGNGQASTPTEVLLSQSEVLRALAPDERRALAARLTDVPVRRGALVMRADEPASSMFFVREGVLEVHLRDSAGHDVPVNRIAPGDVIGEMSLLTGAPRSATVVALTPAVLCELRKEDLAPLLDQRPALGEALAELAARRHEQAAAQIAASEGFDKMEAVGSAGILARLRAFFGLASSA